MIGIAEHDFGAGRANGLRHQALHGALRAHRHEGRRLHAAVRRDDFAAARGAVGCKQAKRKAVGHSGVMPAIYARRTMAGTRCLMVGAPTCCIAPYNSTRISSSTRSTPGCPKAPRPQI